MKTFINQQGVNNNLDELRRVANLLKEYAGPVYSITNVDPTFDEIMRIYSQKTHFTCVAEARKVLGECGERAGKRFTITDEQKRKFTRTIANIRGPKIRRKNKFLKAEAFLIREGRVTVNEGKILKELQKEHTITVSDESATMNSWMATFVSIVNSCPDLGTKRRLGQFSLMLGTNLKGSRVEVDINDNLQIVDL